MRREVLAGQAARRSARRYRYDRDESCNARNERNLNHGAPHPIEPVQPVGSLEAISKFELFQIPGSRRMQGQPTSVHQNNVVVPRQSLMPEVQEARRQMPPAEYSFRDRLLVVTRGSPLPAGATADARRRSISC